MKKVIIWICILAFAGIVDTCFYFIDSSDSIIQAHAASVTATSQTNTNSTDNITQKADKTNSVSKLSSSSTPSHSQLVEENANYNLTNAEMELYNNSNTFSPAATKLYNQLENCIYTSYNVNQLGYRTVVNLNNFITIDGIRYYDIFNYYTIPTEGTISNPQGIANPNGSVYNYAGLVSNYYMCATGQKLTAKQSQNGTKNPLNSNLTDAQITNQLTKIMTEYVKGATQMPGVTASINLNANTNINNINYYQVTLSNPSGDQSNMQLRGTRTEAIFYASTNGRIWQTKDQAFLYSGYYYKGIKFDGQTYFKNAFDKNWGVSQT